MGRETFGEVGGDVSDHLQDPTQHTPCWRLQVSEGEYEKVEERRGRGSARTTSERKKEDRVRGREERMEGCRNRRLCASTRVCMCVCMFVCA